MREVAISDKELISSPLPPLNFIVHRLIEEGAPLKLLRENKFDASEYREDEVEFLGEIKKEYLPFTLCTHYTFKEAQS